MLNCHLHTLRYHSYSWTSNHLIIIDQWQQTIRFYIIWNNHLQKMWKYIYKIELDKVIANMFKGQQWISYLLKGDETFQKEVITSQEGIGQKGKSKLFVRGGWRCNYGNWGFQLFLPHGCVLADWSEINYGNPAVIFHHRITHILWKTIKIASTE